MSLAASIAVTASGTFFMVGLLSGAWKYWHIHRSADAKTDAQATAPVYVDITHSASLMYAFSCLVVERFVELSNLTDAIETAAVLAQVIFFALAVLTYIIHGVLRGTDNQLARPHKVGTMTLPNAVIFAFMASLILGEIGGFAVLLWGALIT